MKPSTIHTDFRSSFQSPPAIYRGAPFWSWNGALEKEELLRQIDVFQQMGIGGFTIHVRTGLETEYLGDEFMELVEMSCARAAEKGMLVWLYDEDRWPSGYAGGLVTRHEEFRVRQLLFTRTPLDSGRAVAITSAGAVAARQAKGELLARFAVKLADKHLQSYRVLLEGEAVGEGETLWYAYLQVAGTSSWFNNQTYVDTLNPRAIRAFIRTTHERYRQVVGGRFGSVIPAMFTDEPQFIHRKPLHRAESGHDVFFPWTPDLDASFAGAFGETMSSRLPELVWDLPGKKASLWRHRYSDWVGERFASSFADQLGAWCGEHGLALTGHMMEEPTLCSQTNALGDAMRSYRAFQIPGIDMLCNDMELNTAKQAQSAARQFGRPGTLSELYGVTGWDFDFLGHKQQGDWQAALGVLHRVHHLTWYGMKGEAKRDYPASIGCQSPWFKEYSVIEDHFARLGAVLSRGAPLCHVAVVHPIESYWLCAGPLDTSATERRKRETNFAALTEWLLYGGIDFDFVSESLLPDQKDSSEPGLFGVGAMKYKAVVVPGMRTIRSTTLDRLERFRASGGHIVFAGEIPSLVDAVPSGRGEALAARCERVNFDEAGILDSLDRHRLVGFLYKEANENNPPPSHRVASSLTRSLLHQLREEDGVRYLFICNTNKVQRMFSAEHFTITLPGEWKLDALDTATGESAPVAARYGSGTTCADAWLEAACHLLLRLEKGQRWHGASLEPQAVEEVARLSSPVAVTLDEPNVLLLDKAEFSVNGGPWRPETPLLDIENILRAELGMPKKNGEIAQPWNDRSPVVPLAEIRLRASFRSEADCTGVRLAFENPDETKITLDGRPVEVNVNGWFTDRALVTTDLPNIGAGQHTVELALAFTRKTSVEWFYLLGDFGVRIEGDRGVLTPPVRRLSFGDWTQQGLPFYGGNATYHCRLPQADASLVQVPQFAASVLKLSVSGVGKRVYHRSARTALPLAPGGMLDLTVCGHRGNCFGPVHLSDPSVEWLGPDAWRSRGRQYSNEYQLKPLGLLTAPILYRPTEGPFDESSVFFR